MRRASICALQRCTWPLGGAVTYAYEVFNGQGRLFRSESHAACVRWADDHGYEVAP